MKKNITIIVLIAINIGTLLSMPKPDFSTPENTIHTFYSAREYSDVQLMRKCLIPEVIYSDYWLGKTWTSYSIASKEIITAEELAREEVAGQVGWDKYHKVSRIELDDVDITVNIRIDDEDLYEGYHSFNVWYRLRKINSEWKVLYEGESLPFILNEVAKTEEMRTYMKKEHAKTIRYAEEKDWTGFIRIFDSETMAEFEPAHNFYTTKGEAQIKIMEYFVEHCSSPDFIDHPVVIIVREDNAYKLKMVEAFFFLKSPEGQKQWLKRIFAITD